MFIFVFSKLLKFSFIMYLVVLDIDTSFKQTDCLEKSLCVVNVKSSSLSPEKNKNISGW